MTNGMKCIACGQPAVKTAIRADIEAAFCHYHYPIPKAKIKIVVCIRC